MRRRTLAGLDVFLAVARHGSLRAAARSLDVRPSAVSQQLSALERHLGASLFTRTTRAVRLTEAGERLLLRAEPAMAELLDAVEEAQSSYGEPGGILRITLPEVVLRMVFEPILNEFRRTFPRITLELSVDDGFVDLVEDGFHAGVRPGRYINEDMVAVRLTPPLLDSFFASPGYLAEHGRPQTPHDLLKHNCILYRFIATKKLEEWPFKGPSGTYHVGVRGNLIVNNTVFLVDAARDGLGVASFYRAAVEPFVKSGQIEFLLEEYCTEFPGFYLYFPKNLQRLRRLRVLVDWLTRGGKPSHGAGHDAPSQVRPGRGKRVSSK